MTIEIDATGTLITFSKSELPKALFSVRGLLKGKCETTTDFNEVFAAMNEAGKWGGSVKVTDGADGKRLVVVKNQGTRILQRLYRAKDS